MENKNEKNDFKKELKDRKKKGIIAYIITISALIIFTIVVWGIVNKQKNNDTIENSTETPTEVSTIVQDIVAIDDNGDVVDATTGKKLSDEDDPFNKANVMFKEIPGLVVGKTEPYFYPMKVFVCTKCGELSPLDKQIDEEVSKLKEDGIISTTSNGKVKINEDKNTQTITVTTNANTNEVITATTESGQDVTNVVKEQKNTQENTTQTIAKKTTESTTEKTTQGTTEKTTQSTIEKTTESTTEKTTEHTHKYTSTRVEATCTQNGKITYKCSCGDSYTETIKATGHKWGSTYTEVTDRQDPQGYYQEQLISNTGINLTTTYGITSYDEFASFIDTLDDEEYMRIGDGFYTTTVWVQQSDGYEEITTYHKCETCGQVEVVSVEKRTIN